MSNLENLTRFAATSRPSLTREGKGILLVCIAGRFALPAAGQSAGLATTPVAEQPPPALADVYFGEPGNSSLKYEGQTAYYRPGTDIYVLGSAWAPRAQPVTSVLVTVRVGPCEKSVLVTGDREWTRGLIGTRMSAPAPFTAMPLRYERAFGGTTKSADDRPGPWEPRNPVGCGLYADGQHAQGRPLPNLEDPDCLISSIHDRPQPTGFGPIARSWQPRLAYAGTYDEPWVSRRAPLWPLDFDERFFCAAAPGLTSPGHLAGGEAVMLSGLSPAGRIQFTLPVIRLAAKAQFRRRVHRQLMTLDTVQIEPDEGVFTLLWRTAIPAHRELHDHVSTVIRQLEPWEVG